MISVYLSKDLEDIYLVLKIAEELPLWFTKEALKNMKNDFSKNNLIVCKNNSEAIGFLCYSKLDKSIKILWMGVGKSFQRKGIGGKLLNFLFDEAKKIRIFLNFS